MYKRLLVLSLFVLSACSTPDISVGMPDLEPTEIPAEQDWDTYRKNLIQKINTINTFKFLGTREVISKTSNTLLYRSENEYSEPNKLHEIIRYENGNITESVFVDEKKCSRMNESEWKCRSQAGIWWPSFREYWIQIIEGQPRWSGSIVIDHGSRTDSREGKTCRLFYMTELFLGDEEHAIFLYEACFDLNSYYPVQSVEVAKYIANNEITDTSRSERQYYDFNTEIDIILPTPSTSTIETDKYPLLEIHADVVFGESGAAPGQFDRPRGLSPKSPSLAFQPKVY